MSRDFHLRCVTCDPPRPRNVDYSDGRFCWGKGHDWNWCGDDLLALLPHLPLFVTVAKAGFDIDGGSLDIGGRIDGCNGIASFALVHAGHDVRVWDEYGSEWPQRKRALIVDRRLVVTPTDEAGVTRWPMPVDVLACGHEVEVDSRSVPSKVGDTRECPSCVETA